MKRHGNSLMDKRIVLTGASSGIGKAAALRFSKSGAKILAIGRDEERLAALDLESENFQGKISPHVCDVTSPEQIESLVEVTKKSLGTVDTLINNAGAIFVDQIQDLSVENFDSVISVCLKAPFLLSKAFMPMLEKSKGSIINVSSVCAVTGFPGSSAYCAAKAGLEGMTRAMVEEFRPKGIKVSVLRPGATETPLWKSIPGEFDFSKMLTPEKVAESMEFLLLQSSFSWTETLEILPPEGNL
ncbi:MAG: SDR family oxidoreductase [Nitrospinota bacterium]|nr:SDR family oxidoreductase [Nitrospinota bacterium]